MFENAARLYWQAKCEVGHGPTVKETRIYGYGCQIAPGVVLTARHVIGSTGARVLLDDGLWNADLAGEWPERDIALLRTSSLAKALGAGTGISTAYPRLSDSKPALGQVLGYVGSLVLNHAAFKATRHTYFGQGHVAFFTKNRDGELVFALAGGAIQKGFSGGPVFTPAGELTGVLVEALEYMPDLNHPARATNVVALLMPIAPIAEAISRLIASEP